ncbi:MAG: S8 family serine peptidase, partial [Microthrixaceae bacterium]
MSLAVFDSNFLRKAGFALPAALLLLSACGAAPPPSNDPSPVPVPTITAPTTTVPPSVQPLPSAASGICRPLGTAASSSSTSLTQLPSSSDSLSVNEASSEATAAFIYAVIDPNVPGDSDSVAVVVTSVDSTGRPQIQQVTVNSLNQARNQVADIARNSIDQGLQVVSVEPELTLRTDGSPVTNDPGRPSQWALTQFSFESTWPRTTGTGVCVAVVDSGIALNHVDLAGKVAASADFSGEGVTSYGDHATHVAGIIAAIANNGQGVVGASPGVSLLN